MLTKTKMAAFGLSFLLPSLAEAACYIDGASGRLASYCALDKIQGARVDLRSLQLIDYKLKLEGKTDGLGFPSRIEKKSLTKSLYPILSYSDNINGGNSPEPLVLGNLSFDGEKELYRKEGILVGLGARFGGRYIYREGRYINYGVNASYAHSPEHDLGVAITSANICSVTYIKNLWYLDACANTSRTRKDITDDTNSNISLVSSKVYSSGEDTYSEASFGINHYFAESYTQNQLVLGFDTIHPGGVHSAIDVTFGEAVENQIPTKFSLWAKVITQLAKNR